MTFDDDDRPSDRPSSKRAIRVPDPSKITGYKKIVGDDFALPPAYPEALAEFATMYRVTDTLPKINYEKLNVKPKDNFRMFPAKYRRAFSYASPHAKLVFIALWGQHEDRWARANGLLVAPVEWLQRQTGLGKRNHITDAVLELEVRGLIRVMRGRGVGGKGYPSMYLLTGFPDCLGNPPTLDYETCGLPQDTPKANSEESRSVEAQLIADRFNSRINAAMELARHFRRTGGGIE